MSHAGDPDTEKKQLRVDIIIVITSSQCTSLKHNTIVPDYKMYNFLREKRKKDPHINTQRRGAVRDSRQRLVRSAGFKVMGVSLQVKMEVGVRRLVELKVIWGKVTPGSVFSPFDLNDLKYTHKNITKPLGTQWEQSTKNVTCYPQVKRTSVFSRTCEFLNFITDSIQLFRETLHLHLKWFPTVFLVTLAQSLLLLIY